MTHLKILLLGSPLIEQDNRVVDIPRRKAQALLFYLALTAEPQQRATLAALLWPESDQQQAYGALRRHLSELNAALGGGWITTGNGTVALAHPDDLWVDLFAFRQHLAHCQSHDHATTTVCPACIGPLTDAVALYRADFLEGFTLPDAPAFDEWQFFQGEALRQSYVEALEKLVQAHIANDDVTSAITYARRRLSLDLLHEAAHRQLMQLYAAGGQQSAALRQYELCAQSLRAELDVAPAAETTALYEQIRQGFATPLNESGPSKHTKEAFAHHNLPASTTPFIGRVKEVETLTRLCQDETRRLITILGPGGIGKTRLALEVAACLVDEFAGDLCFVRLAQLTDPANITQAIAIALNLQFHVDGRTPKQQLFSYLQQKRMLLVLDNFEHLLEGAALLQELLQSCPTVRLLVTSRERLQLMGETLFTLGSLEFPAWETPEWAHSYEAIQLFIGSAQRIRPTEALGKEEMHSITRICRLVGGMPLGIILAASWMEVLSPAEIAAELTRGFDLLERELRDLPERQRSMRAVLAYSWQHLTAAEQAVFMRLALFRGGFTRAAAEQIAGASLSTLARLVDKSIVQRTGEKRYDIHELLRQYAEQQLELAALRPQIEEAHGHYYLNFLHGCEAKMAGSEQLEALHQLEADFENVRAAWLWAVQTHNYALVDHALNGLFRWFFWLRRSRQQEGIALLMAARQTWASSAQAITHPVWGRIQARLLEQQGPWLDKPLETRQRLQEALLFVQQQGEQCELLFCKWALGLTIVSEEASISPGADMQPAIRYFEECIAAYRASGDSFWLAQSLEKLGHTYRRLNQCDNAIVVLQESLDLRRAQGDRFGIARSLRELAWTRLNQGMEEETLETAQAAYVLQVELDDQQGIADSRFFLALILLIGGDWQQALMWVKPVEQLAVEMNSTLYQRWASICMTMAACMEENMRLRHFTSTSFPNRFNAYTSRLWYLLFSAHSTLRYRDHLEKLFRLATSDAETALCLLFGAKLLAILGEWQRALLLMALALRYPTLAEGWIVHTPAIVTFEAELRKHLSPAEFVGIWEQGQSLDLQNTAVEFLHELLNDQEKFAPVT